jgi:hypothetical protein
MAQFSVIDNTFQNLIQFFKSNIIWQRKAQVIEKLLGY